MVTPSKLPPSTNKYGVNGGIYGGIYWCNFLFFLIHTLHLVDCQYINTFTYKRFQLQEYVTTYTYEIDNGRNLTEVSW